MERSGQWHLPSIPSCMHSQGGMSGTWKGTGPDSMDIRNSALVPSITWFQAHGIMQTAVKRGLARKSSTPSRIGIDEKSYGRGHRYLTLVFNHDNLGVDFLTLDTREESLDQYYGKIGEDESSRINAVSLHMRDQYIASTRKHVESADSKMVFDRLRIMKHMNMPLDEVRRMESRLAYAKDTLKKTRYISLYSSENLPDKYREWYQ